MGLGVKYYEETAYPIFICDSCGKEIEDWRLAILSYEMPAPHEASSGAYVYHKEPCASDKPLRYELSSYLPVLLWNHNWGRRQQREENNEVIREVCVEVSRTVR